MSDLRLRIAHVSDLVIPDDLVALQRVADRAFAGLGDVAADFPTSTLDWSEEQRAAWDAQWQRWAKAVEEKRQAMEPLVAEHGHYTVDHELKKAARHAAPTAA